MSSTSAQNNAPEVRINPYFSEPEVTVSSADQIILDWGWGTAKPNLVRPFTRAVEQTYVLNGQVVFETSHPNQNWGSVERRTPDETPAACKALATQRPNGGTTGQPSAQSRWTLNLGNLEPGVYVLHGTVSLSQQVTDGCDGNADNQPDLYGPGIVCQFGVCMDRTITIYVE